MGARALRRVRVAQERVSLLNQLPRRGRGVRRRGRYAWSSKHWMTTPPHPSRRSCGRCSASLEKMTLAHEQLGPDDVRPALRAGVSRVAIAEAMEVAFLFNIYDRMADTMGWDVPPVSAGRLLQDGRTTPVEARLPNAGAPPTSTPSTNDLQAAGLQSNCDDTLMSPTRTTGNPADAKRRAGCSGHSRIPQRHSAADERQVRYWRSRSPEERLAQAAEYRLAGAGALTEPVSWRWSVSFGRGER